MKKVILVLVALQLLSLIFHAQVTPKKEDIAKLRKINQQLVTSFKKKDYKEAQKFAQKAVTLSKTIFGNESNETASSYKNLGEIYRLRKKYDEAVEYFDKSLAIYTKDTKQNEKKIFELLESKGTALAFDGKKKEAESVFFSYIKIAEEKHGKGSEELFPYLKKQHALYLYLKDFDKADEVMIRQRIIAFRNNNTDVINDLKDETYCYLHQNLSSKEIFKREKKIFEAVKKAVGEDKFKPNPNQKDVKRISGGVVNGKATYLAKPSYPSRASNLGARGAVLVRILIDDKGKVVEAKAFCGHPYLREASENAAKNSKFRPTLIEGKVVEVRGMIVYNYN